MTDAVGDVKFLAGSEHRVQILESLRENGRMTNHELRDRVDAERTTVGRNLAALCDRGWIRRTNTHCAITRQGELVAAAFSGLVETVERTDRLGSFLRWVPDGSLDLDLRHLAGAEVLLPTPGDPWAMVNHHVAVIGETSDDRVMLPVTGLHAIETVHRKIVAGDARTELVVEPQIAATFRSNPDFAPLVEEMVATDRFEVRVYDGDIPYYLGVLDSTVQIGVDEDGEPRAMLETDSAAVEDWARAVFADYERHSTPLRVVH